MGLIPTELVFQSQAKVNPHFPAFFSVDREAWYIVVGSRSPAPDSNQCYAFTLRLRKCCLGDEQRRSASFLDNVLTTMDEDVSNIREV